MKKGSRLRASHAFAAVAGLIAFAVVFFQTGDGNLWLAAQCGLGVMLAIYFLVHLRDPGTSDGGV